MAWRLLRIRDAIKESHFRAVKAALSARPMMFCTSKISLKSGLWQAFTTRPSAIRPVNGLRCAVPSWDGFFSPLFNRSGLRNQPLRRSCSSELEPEQCKRRASKCAIFQPTNWVMSTAPAAAAATTSPSRLPAAAAIRRSPSPRSPNPEEVQEVEVEEVAEVLLTRTPGREAERLPPALSPPFLKPSPLSPRHLNGRGLT